MNAILCSLDRRHYDDARGMEALWSVQKEDRESIARGSSWWIRDDEELTGEDVPKPMTKVGF